MGINIDTEIDILPSFVGSDVWHLYDLNLRELYQQLVVRNLLL